METATSAALLELDEDSLSIETGRILSVCQDLLEHMGFKRLAEELNLAAALTQIRKVVLLLDSVVVCYVRSHGSGFDVPSDGLPNKPLEVGVGEDRFGFKCLMTGLACLDDFIDKRSVFVFHFYDGNDYPARRATNIGSQVLTRMQDLADIWGPVHAVPSINGFIKYYGV